MGLDYVDFLLCHRPDPETPLEETVAAIGHLLARGDILYWGTSEWPAAMIEAAIKTADSQGIRRPGVEQSQYNLFERRRVEVHLPPLAASGVGVCAWSPLFYGLLAGRKFEESRMNRPDMEWLRNLVLPLADRRTKMTVIAEFESVAASARAVARRSGDLLVSRR